MKKIVILALGLSLVAAACNKTAVVTPAPAPVPPPPPAAPTTQTYTNSTYGFTFVFPVSYSFATPTYANLQDKITQVQTPRDAYPGTNFGDAAVAASAQFAKTLADCLKLTPPENSDGFKTKVSINGVDFYMTKSSGAGAGNLYSGNVYRTFAGGKTCIELSEMIHTSNIGNYDPGTVTEVNQAPIQAQLDSIVQSFKLNS